MENKDWILIVLICIIIGLVVCFATYIFTQTNDTNKIINASNNTALNNTSNNNPTSVDNDNSNSNSKSNIVNETVKINKQANDGSSYREVNYADGGMRQYDTETGKLIGSTYEEDQGRNGGPLPEMH